MGVSADIYGMVKPVQQRNPLAEAAQLMQLQGAMGQNALSTYTLKKAQRDDMNTESLNSLYQAAMNPDGTIDRSRLMTGAAQAGLGSQIPTIQKGLNDADMAKATLSQANSKASEEKLKLSRDSLVNVQTPEHAAQWVQAQFQDPELAKAAGVPMEVALKSIPQDPAALRDWINQRALGMTKYVELNKPSIHMADSGGAITPLAIPGLGGAPQALGTITKTVTPGEQLSANVSRANNRDSIANENLRAGVVPGGGLDDNAERTAQAIANGQLPAPTGMALLNPKNQRILGRVMEINPQYDATTVSAKKAAATAFTSGREGQMMRSLQVANQHLDQLGQLADAMNNGNLQMVNKLGNVISQQTGSPAVTNFDGAKEIVAKEVMKAIVAGGGGVNEREELARSLSNAKSPAQLGGVIKQYRNLMSAQHDALLAQRDAAGLPRSTLPNYTENGGTAAAPNVNPSAIDAELARRGVK